jgi:hypothetical protein
MLTYYTYYALLTILYYTCSASYDTYLTYLIWDYDTIHDMGSLVLTIWDPWCSLVLPGAPWCSLVLHVTYA